MFKFLSLIIYKFLYIINFLTSKLLDKNLLLWLKEFIEKDSYQSIKINNKNLSFFVPNNLIKWRIKTFFDKEPETINWINNFKKKDLIFWDIGSNIGQYSIYCAIKHPKSKIISFEPSAGNLRILSRNISNNKLTDKIKIITTALTKNHGNFFVFEESNLLEGSAHNNLTEIKKKKLDQNNKIKYKIYGTNINYLIQKNILKIPNYIKIDVDGLEYLILKGADKYLSHNNLKEILIELNENKLIEFNKVKKILKKNNFIFYKKQRNEIFHQTKESKYIYNYIFKKN